MSAWHSTGAWKRARAGALWQWMMSGRPPCELCGQPINELLEVVHVDHRRPVSEGGSLTSPANTRVVHAVCNLARDKGGTSPWTVRRRAMKEAAGWRIADEDRARRSSVPSRVW